MVTGFWDIPETKNVYFLYRLVELVLETDPMCLEFINSLSLFNLSPLFPSLSHWAMMLTFLFILPLFLFLFFILIWSCPRQYNFFLENTALTTKTF